MKFLKFGFVTAMLAMFVFACTKNQNSNTNTANTTNNSVAVFNSNNVNAQPTAATDELASARKIYAEKCVNCHKEGGVGGVSEIEGRKIKAPNFTSDRMKNDDENDWIETINNGAKEDGMPAFKGKLSDDDIKGLVKLIRKDFQGK